MKYRVTEDEKAYVINVERIDEKEIFPVGETGEDVSMEACRNEYDHCIERSAKLDNKVYILLTVCAFLFVMLSEIIKKVGKLKLPDNKVHFIVDGGYIVLLTVNVAVFILLLMELIHLLRGIKLMRFDSAEILERDTISQDKETTIRFICMHYEQCKSYNNSLIEKQYEKFNGCVKLMMANIVLILAAFLYSSVM